MPKRVSVSEPTPSDVAAATEVFGSVLRVHLVRWFARHPGSRQADAVRALGADRAVVSFNVNALVDRGALRADDEGRTYRVDQERCRHLTEALAAFVAAT